MPVNLEVGFKLKKWIWESSLFSFREEQTAQCSRILQGSNGALS